MENFELNEQEFRSWLVENEDRGVGKAGSVCFCPLVAFIENKLGEEVSIDGKVICFLKTGKSMDLPLWAKIFITKFDHGFITYTHVKGKQVLPYLDSAIQLEKEPPEGL